MYDRNVNGQTLTFGVSGMLYQNGLIMYDHQTAGLWSHILGQAIAGDLKGTHLEFVPALQTDWATWLERHPDSLVVDPRNFGRDSYASYYNSSQEGVLGGPNRDDDIYSKEYVIGLRLDGEAKAYPFSVLNNEPVVNDVVADIPVAVFFDKSRLTGTVFNRAFEDGTLLTFEAGPSATVVIDDQTRSEWDALTGEALSGPLAGSQLAQVPITYSFWFGWADYHVGGTVYQGAQ